jgi:hypothetical protein
MILNAFRREQIAVFGVHVIAFETNISIQASVFGDAEN